jgi:hypothetical protein
MPPPTSDQTAPLTKREEIAEGTMAFHFAKPADFQFRAGQSIDLTLLNPPETDAEGNSRAFSIASAPFDNDLMIATRMRDTALKRVLRKWSAERGRFNSSWFWDFPLRRVMSTLPANLRTTPSSFLPSRTRWSTLAVMHAKKRRASQRRCCQRCFSTIHRVKPVFPLTEGRSPTTPLIRSSRFSQMER